MTNRKEVSMMASNRELDLQAPNRKPDRAIRVGDYVKVKSKEWYNKWKNPAGCIGAFVSGMDIYCGKVFPVERISGDSNIYLKDVFGIWEPEYFEEVYPKEEYIGCKIGADYCILASRMSIAHDFANAVGTILPTDIISVGTFCANGVTIPQKPEKQKQKLKLINKFKPIKLKKL